MDQGGELFKNPNVRKIFEKRGFKINPTIMDESHQNGPVEQSHCTVTKAIHTFLLGASVPVKFSPTHFIIHYK